MQALQVFCLVVIAAVAVSAAPMSSQEKLNTGKQAVKPKGYWHYPDHHFGHHGDHHYDHHGDHHYDGHHGSWPFYHYADPHYEHDQAHLESIVKAQLGYPGYYPDHYDHHYDHHFAHHW